MNHPNIIWIWDVQDLSWDFAAYNPGEGYFDIAAMDMYGDGYTQEKYKAMLEVAGDKPIAIGECETLPTPYELAAQPRWVFFMGWAELVYAGNTEQQIKTLYASDRVVNLDEFGQNLTYPVQYSKIPLYFLRTTFPSRRSDPCPNPSRPTFGEAFA